ncbi:hypothetical protein HMPREF0501_00780 [Limosilactobacillus coleohominis 101-4-CHN]|uniref:Uncharacterized protein n=1 Tax=Limosilactobacillus coleohominis 101-4-CHN TaxID=575594 RepID=C7XVN6_9LACO|nr:hypothetical protein HMPREF0501_00780 [Limosilactobacillus coleohominis 101-4-CHN]
MQHYIIDQKNGKIGNDLFKNYLAFLDLWYTQQDKLNRRRSYNYVN